MLSLCVVMLTVMSSVLGMEQGCPPLLPEIFEKDEICELIERTQQCPHCASRVLSTPSICNDRNSPDSQVISLCEAAGMMATPPRMCFKDTWDLLTELSPTRDINPSFRGFGHRIHNLLAIVSEPMRIGKHSGKQLEFVIALSEDVQSYHARFVLILSQNVKKDGTSNVSKRIGGGGYIEINGKRKQIDWLQVQHPDSGKTTGIVVRTTVGPGYLPSPHAFYIGEHSPSDVSLLYPFDSVAMP